MNRFWIVNGTIFTSNDEHGWSEVTQIPTFIMDGWVQGILDIDNAHRIALAMVNTIGKAGRPDNSRFDVHISIAAADHYPALASDYPKGL